MSARRGIKSANVKSTKLDNGAKRKAQSAKPILFFVLVVIVVVFWVVVDATATYAGKVKDIKKRARAGASVFVPTSVQRQREVKMIRNSVFFSPLETAIADGPSHNSVVQNTRAEFTLDGWQIVPFEKVNRFDVWLIGFDGGWKEVSGRVVYDLPAGPKTYTLLARAKNNKGEFDNTAAVRTFSVNVSPYFGRIKVTNVSVRGASDRPHYEKLSLYNQSSDRPVDVTGWRVAIRRSNFSFVVPAAANVLDTRSSVENDRVVLARGHTLDVYFGKRSPVGVNFQENACSAFFRDSFESYDALSSFGSCPPPDPSSYSGFSAACRSFVRGLNACGAPQLGLYQFANEPSCRDFIIRNFNYAACVSRARSRANFYSGRWRVYLGRSEGVMDDLDDTISLYDNAGLLVDRYEY